MKKTEFPLRETLLLLLGEAAVSLLTCGVFLLIKKFDYTVVTGTALGSVIAIMNFIILAVSLNSVFNKARAERGDKELSDEEVEAFTEKFTAEYNARVKISYIIRTLAMLGVLILAFILDVFNVLATVIPLLMFRPIFFVISLINKSEEKLEAVITDVESEEFKSADENEDNKEDNKEEENTEYSKKEDTEQ